MPTREPRSTAVDPGSEPAQSEPSAPSLKLEDIRKLVDKVHEQMPDEPDPESDSDELLRSRAASPGQAFNALYKLVAPEAPSTLTALSGTVLERRYRLGRVLGSGGMGAVFEALHLRLDRPVAIKVLQPKLATESEYIKRFLREAKAASKIRHRNVVEILDYGETTGGLVYSVMEFLEGRDLRQVLREQPNNRLPWAKAYGLLLHIVSGLKAVHRRGVIHRDIKPANCFLTDEDGDLVVKLLDFGLAKFEDPSRDSALTNASQMMGTPGYMAPELAQKQQPATAQSDIYALGVLAYRTLIGRLPFWGDTMYETLRMTCTEPVPSLREQVSEIPPQVEAFVLQLLAKDPAHRPATMKVVREQMVQLGQATLSGHVGMGLVSSSLLAGIGDGLPAEGHTAPPGVEGPAGQARMTADPFAPTIAGAAAVEPPPPTPVTRVEYPPQAPVAGMMEAPPNSGHGAPLARPLVHHGVSATGPHRSAEGRGMLWLALVLGSGATVVLAILLAWSLQRGGDEPPARAVARTPASVSEPTAAVAPPAAATPVPPAPETAPSTPGAAEPVPTTGDAEAPPPDAVEPAPTQPQSESSPRRPMKKRKAKAANSVPADSVVLARLNKKIARNCEAELRGGPTTVKFVVTASGQVVGLSASGPAGSCARAQAKGSKFRERSSSEPFKLLVK